MADLKISFKKFTRKNIKMNSRRKDFGMNTD